MLSCVGLSKSFGALVAVREVSLEIPVGERHAVIGPNGAGKTTLFNLIGGVIRADTGTIRFENLDIGKLPPERRTRLGLSRSFQRNSCFLDMTVAENLATAVLLAERLEWRIAPSIRHFPAVRKRVEAIAASVGIGEWLELPARRLSYGTQRQLEVGLSLASAPRVLLLDEPTAGMSPEETRRIQALIASLPRTLTIVIIEHDMDVVFSLADRITVLDTGSVLMRGTPHEVRASAAVRNRYLGGTRT
ncbi:MAG: ABC transporter ATP-binding protein [Xanthobacteraceae bacterium]